MGKILDELRRETESNKINSELTEEIKNILQSDVMQTIQTELDKKIEGEQTARMVIFLVMNMRNVQNLSKASDNLMINDDAGTGKDHVASAIYELIPDHEKLKRERISAKVLAYLHDAKSNPEGWAKKVLYLEDVPNAVLNDDAFKVMSSANPNGITQTSIICNNALKNIDIKGKPSIILTIASASPKQELLRRYPIISLTSSIKQTQAILRKQADFAKMGISHDYNPMVKQALAHLGRISVRIPFADKITNAFPSQNVIVRTHFPRFLDYIKSSCSLYQFQRKIDDEGYYLAEEQDYEMARQALAATTSNQLMIPQTKIEKNVAGIFSKIELREYTIEELSDLMQKFGGESYIRKTLEKLARDGFVKKRYEKQEKGRPFSLYSYNNMVKLELPSFEELDSILSFITSLISFIFFVPPKNTKLFLLFYYS